jgi:hypothetical protein
LVNEDERSYETLDRDITAAMLRAADNCTIRKQHGTPWAPSLSEANNINLTQRGKIMILIVNHEVINMMSPIGSLVIC